MVRIRRLTMGNLKNQVWLSVFSIAFLTICGTVFYYYYLCMESPVGQENSQLRQTLPLKGLTYHYNHSIRPKVIHIAVIVSGYEETRNSYLAIKSLLIHRSTNIHLHFVADYIATRALKSIMSTWLLPGVRYDYYDLGHAQRLAKTGHCVGSLLVKLNLHLILPDNVTEVVVLDSSAIIAADILEFVMQVLPLREQSLVLSGAKCLLDSSGKKTMSLSKLDFVHFSGVMFIRLYKLRSSLQKDSWAQAVGNFAAGCGEMSSKTVLSAIEKFTLAITNCSWNSHTHASLDSFPDLYWKTVSVFKQQDLMQGPAHLVNISKAVQSYDGYELRYKKAGVQIGFKDDPVLQRSSPFNNSCPLLEWERKQVRRAFPFVLEYSYNSTDKYDVTMAVHLEVSRIHLIEQIALHWEGPMSVGIELTDSQVQEFVDFVSNSGNLKNRLNISYHLLFKLGPNYPINPLRYLAHKKTATPYIFFNDVDFIPNFGLYSSMKHKIQNREDWTKIAMVIPAFETFIKTFSYPRNKEEMVKLMETKKVEQFHVRGMPTGHGATNYEKWKTAKEPYFVLWITNFEPYTVTKTSVFPFDPRFIGRMNNKASFVHQLHMAGYRFLVSNNDFIIHMPHIKPKYIYEKCMTHVYPQWLAEKRKQYG